MGQYDSTQDVPFIHADTTIEAEGGFTLVSVDQNSSALIKPVEHSTPKRGKRMDEKKMDECPQQTCNISNYRRHTIHWVTCDSCGQWFHQYCIGLNPSKLKNLKVGCVQHVLVDSVFHLYLLAYMYIFYEPSYNLHFYLV